MYNNPESGNPSPENRINGDNVPRFETPAGLSGSEIPYKQDTPRYSYTPQSDTGYNPPQSRVYYGGKNPPYSAPRAFSGENTSGFYGTGILPPGVGELPQRRSRRRRRIAITVSSIVIVLLVAAAFVGGGFLLDFSSSPSPSAESPGVSPSFPVPAPTSGNFGENPLEAQGGGNAVLELSDTPTPTPRITEDGELTVTQIAKKVRPSVVGVVAEIANSYGSTSGGSGIIMNKAGFIITNCHVIEYASKITVILDNGESYDAGLIGKDERTDLAILKIDAPDLEPAEFGNSDVLEVGELVVAIGTPMSLELQSTVTVGYISAINRVVSYDDREITMIQTDAAINFGNSGGPLINRFGQVIGINTMKYVGYDSMAEGLGFAIPITPAKPVIDELVVNGYIKGRPAIGISGYTLDEATAEYNELPQGVYVAEVNELSDSHGKIQVGDVIIAANGETITSMADINDAKEGLQVGDELPLTLYRDGENVDVVIILADSADINQ